MDIYTSATAQVKFYDGILEMTTLKTNITESEFDAILSMLGVWATEAKNNPFSLLCDFSNAVPDDYMAKTMRLIAFVKYNEKVLNETVECITLVMPACMKEAIDLSLTFLQKPKPIGIFDTKESCLVYIEEIVKENLHARHFSARSNQKKQPA